jgi:arsenical pump membrane protein
MFLFVHIPALAKTIIILVIAVATLLGIMIRPFKLNEATFALAGAILILLLGLLTPQRAAITLFQDWNTFLFFLGMMSLSALAEVAGLFDWAATQAARLSGNSSRRLFFNIFLLGTLISTLLSNDATALILTPIVYTLVTRLKLPVLPFLFACTFIADTASFILPVSNPINIIILSRYSLNLLTFARLLLLPSIVAISINIGVFFFLYRKNLRDSFDIKRLPSTEQTIKHKGYFRFVCVVLALVAIAYIVASATQIPLSIVSLGGSLLLLIGALRWKQTTLPNVGKQISWSIFGFIAGMFLVVQAVESTGLTTQFGQLLLHLSGNNGFGAVMIGTLGSALGTNVINNVPMAVVLNSSLQGIQHATPAVRYGFIGSAMFGCDLGPNLTTVGSLSTVLWLLILRQRNLDVSGFDYFKIGLLVTPLMLVTGALAMWLLLPR